MILRATTTRLNLLAAIQIVTIALAMGIATCWVNANGESTGESIDSEGEESGTQYQIDETFDETRNGARLVLKYDSKVQNFTGHVENTTKAKLTNVRVEVHLSNGTELGPTKPQDLEPNQKISVTLSATDQKFKTWGAHPEVGKQGSGEHGGSEGDGEHRGKESSGEHGDESERGEHS